MRPVPSRIHLNYVIETTAYSLATTLGFLALSNDVQDEIFEHIISVVGHDRAPVSASNTK